MGRRLRAVARSVSIGFLLLLVEGCTGSTAPRGVLPPVVDDPSIAAGDRISIVATSEGGGVAKKQLDVPPDGRVDVWCATGIDLRSRSPESLARAISDALLVCEGRRSQVIVSVVEARSKRVTVVGQVDKPGVYPFQQGMTLIGALALAGGLTQSAARDRVYVERTTADGKKHRASFAIDPITSGQALDVPLQPGDVLFVGER